MPVVEFADSPMRRSVLKIPNETENAASVSLVSLRFLFDTFILILYYARAHR